MKYFSGLDSENSTVWTNKAQMLRTNLFVLTARSNNSGLSQQQKIVVHGLPPNLQPSLIYLKWVLRSDLLYDWSHLMATVTYGAIRHPFTSVINTSTVYCAVIGHTCLQSHLH